jgi:hypothetical protein
MQTSTVPQNSKMSEPEKSREYVFAGVMVKRFWAMVVGTLILTGYSFAQVDAPSSRVPKDIPDTQAAHFVATRTLSYEERLPDAPSARPLTDREKFQLFTDDARSPLTFVSAGLTAGYNTANNRLYGSGWGGFSRNYATAVAEHETASFFGKYVFPTLLSQDPRYHPSEKEGFWKRSSYAASRILITKNDSGEKTVNTSYLLGALVSTAIAASYSPIHRGPGQTMADFGSTVGGDAGMNILKEFWPQLREKIRPLTPKKFRKLEDHLVGYQEPVEIHETSSK